VRSQRSTVEIQHSQQSKTGNQRGHQSKCIAVAAVTIESMGVTPPFLFSVGCTRHMNSLRPIQTWASKFKELDMCSYKPFLNIRTEEDDLTKLGKFFQWSDKIGVKVTTGQVGCQPRNKSSRKEIS